MQYSVSYLFNRPEWLKTELYRLQKRDADENLVSMPGATPTLAFNPNGTYSISDILVQPELCPNTEQWNDCYYASIPRGKNGNLEWTCPAGYFCLSPLDKAPCTPGFFCPENSQQPVYCSPKYYCSNDTSTIARCPQGYFCPTGTVNPLSCGVNKCQEGSSSVPRVFAIPIFVAVVVVVLFIFAAKRRGEKIRRLKYEKEMQNMLDKKPEAEFADGDKVSDNAESILSDGSTDSFSVDKNSVLDIGEVSLDPVQRTFDIRFEHLSCCLKNDIQILDNVSGEARPGRTMAIMGPSGAGKTTLINVLSGKVKKSCGEVFINGAQGELAKYKQLMGYVPQDDIMLKELTVRDILMHSAQMRLPAEMKFQAKRYKVLETASFLGLNTVFDSVIGDEHTRGISGGQRKRVNIGMELVTDPSIVILDEPTSGLDSSTATDICKLLRSISRHKFITVIAIIHSPPPMSFLQFDDLILLGKYGVCGYSGPRNRAVEYFARAGFYMAEGESEADFLLEVITGKVPCAFDPNFTVSEFGVLWSHYGQTFLSLPPSEGPFPRRSIDSSLASSVVNPQSAISTSEHPLLGSRTETVLQNGLHSVKEEDASVSDCSSSISDVLVQQPEAAQLARTSPALSQNTLSNVGPKNGATIPKVVTANISTAVYAGYLPSPTVQSPTDVENSEGSEDLADKHKPERASNDSALGTDTTLSDKLRVNHLSAVSNFQPFAGSQTLHHRINTHSSSGSSSSLNNFLGINCPKAQQAIANNMFGPDIFVLHRVRSQSRVSLSHAQSSLGRPDSWWAKFKNLFRKTKKSNHRKDSSMARSTKHKKSSTHLDVPNDSNSLARKSSTDMGHANQTPSRRPMNSLNLMLRPSFVNMARPIIHNHPRKGVRKIIMGAVDMCKDFIHWNVDVYSELKETCSEIWRFMRNKKNPIRTTPNVFKVFLLTYQRAIVQILRSPGPFILNCLTHIGCGIFISVATQNFTYLGAQPSSLCDTAPLNLQWSCRNPTDNIREVGMFFCLGALFAAMSSAAYTFGNERVVFWRDTAAGMPTLPYFLAKSAADWPLVVLGGFLYSLGFTVFYPYRSSYSYLFVIAVLLYLASFNMGYFISMIVRKENVGLVCTGFALAWALVFAGVIPDLYEVLSPDAPFKPISFLWQISAPRWAVEALWIKEVRARPWIEIWTGDPGHSFYSWDNYEICLRNIGLIALGWSGASFLALKLLRRSKFR